MNPNATMWYIFEGRFPSEKAASLFAAKSCEAFVVRGQKVVLIVPRRLGRSKESYAQYYKINEKIPVVFLPTLDLFRIPLLSKIAFRISLFTFAVSVFFFIRSRYKAGDIAYSNAIVPLYAASLAGAPGFYEVHDFPEKKLGSYKKMLQRMKWILSTNVWKKEKMMEMFKLPASTFIVEPNAVELKHFSTDILKKDAREQLHLPSDRSIALYTGHLYGWKGVDTLALAAELMPDVDVYFVGGTKEDIARFSDMYGGQKNIRVVGHRPHEEMPLWQAAADVLVLPNTAKEKISLYYTSPMKLFEYMASGRPIVASDLPSVRHIAGDDAVMFVEPDEPRAIADAIARILRNPLSASDLAARAREKVREHTWDKRAQRILSFIASHS